MPLDEHFTQAATSFIERETKLGKPRKKRPAPFSIRLSNAERAQLIAEANGAPLARHIKAKLMESGAIPRPRRSGLSIEDRQAHARALALLGQSRLSSNLNQIAHAVNIGVLPVTPETELELFGALADIRELRRLFMVALGLKPEDRP